MCTTCMPGAHTKVKKCNRSSGTSIIDSYKGIEPMYSGIADRALDNGVLYPALTIKKFVSLIRERGGWVAQWAKAFAMQG